MYPSQQGDTQAIKPCERTAVVVNPCLHGGFWSYQARHTTGLTSPENMAFEVGHLRRKTQRFPASCRNRRHALHPATALYTTSLCVPATHQMNDLRDSKQLSLVQLRFGAYRFEILGWFSLSLLLVVGPFLAVSLASPPKMTEGGVGPVSGP